MNKHQSTKYWGIGTNSTGDLNTYLGMTCAAYLTLVRPRLLGYLPNSTSWVNQKMDNVSESSSATAVTSQDLKIGSADPDATLHIHNAKIIWKILRFCFFHSISSRYPRKLKSTNFSTLNSYNNRRSRSRWNLVETITLKTQGEYRYKFHCLIRHPSRDIITKTRFPVKVKCFRQKWGKWHFCDVPLNFTVFDLKK